MKIILILFACASIGMANFLMPPVYVRTPLGDSIDVSTMKVLKEAYNESGDKNVVTSPLGLMILLSMLNEGAGPASKLEITKFLGGTEAKQVTESFQHLSVLFSEMDPDYLSIANKITVNDGFTLNDNFAATARDFRSEFEKLDFSDPEKAAAKINQWAAEKTKGHITSPVSKETLTPVPAVALFNVIFFNGHWHVPFKAEETSEKDFHVTRGNVVKKPMMHLLEPLYHTESKELGASIIELPYKESGFRMVVVLPVEIDGLPSVLEKVAKKGLLSDVFNLQPGHREVDLDMPKFEIRSKLNFNNILPKVGVSSMFTELALGIVNEPVKVSKAFQEAFIKVNEEGATAGAFTGVVMVPLSEPPQVPPPLKFTVDHPFLYAILYQDKVIFAGTYSQ